MKKHALVVGISQYADPEITDLAFAARDAEEVGRCLVEICGFDDVRTLASGGSHDPDHVHVVDALNNLAPLLSREDLFLFYFAGHGIETRTGAHLLTSNSRIRMPELASISTKVLSDCLSRLECADRVLIFDACRNDPRKGMGDQDNLLTSGFSRDIMAVAETPVEGVVPATCVLFSCRLSERAYEWPDKGHGAFTHYLLEGLRGAAADDRGRITVQALGRYVEAQVPRWAKKTRTPRPQTPWGEQKGSWREILLADRTATAPHPGPTPLPKPVTILTEPVLQVETVPPGASLYVNDRDVGMTPIGLALSPGEHRIHAEMDGYKPWERRVRFDGTGDASLRIEMEAEPLRAQASLSGTAPVAACLDAANDGNADAQFNLGVRYFNGQGIEQNEREAIKWYRKAAKQGHAGAQFDLGFCYANGRGVRQNKRQAVKWYRMAAEQGLASAQFYVGACYAVEWDPWEAAKWYLKAAEQGHAGAQFNLGFCYANGQGVEQDEREAVTWYRKAAEQGHVDAQCRLGFCYADGQGVEQDEREAVAWYRQAAEQGHADAQFHLGVSYAGGQGVEQDEREAVTWYRKAAEQGHVDAQCRLGFCYAKGQGIKQDAQEAVKWYCRAVEQGDAEAQFNLGVRYATGQGVEQDEWEAVKWYRKAAEQGHALAQFNLGVCYDDGQGVGQDEKEAAKWYRKAAEQGDEGGIGALKRRGLAP